VTNRNNYSRWTPIYLLCKLNLPSEVESRFKAGFFAIRQKAGSFNGVWSDMATEKTIIKDSKSNGGIVAFLSALIFWSIILAASRNMSQTLNVGKTAHPHSRKSFIRGARCASNKEFRAAISSFHEDISPVKVSYGQCI
jgi:hypothetical protein